MFGAMPCLLTTAARIDKILLSMQSIENLFNKTPAAHWDWDKGNLPPFVLYKSKQENTKWGGGGWWWKAKD